MKILITGSSGLLGLNLAFEAAKKHEVIGVDTLELKPDEFKVLPVDLLSPGAIPQMLDEIEPDWLIHCVALANVEASEKQPELAKRLNEDLAGDVAREAGKRSVRMVHISTDAVFDGQTGNYSEDDPTNPKYVYSATKLDGERMVMDAYPEAVIARVNFYGWSVSGKRSLGEFFFNNLKAKNSIKGFTDAMFSTLLANDLAKYLLALLEKDVSGIFHVASSEPASKYGFGVALAERFGFDPGLITPISLLDTGFQAARSPNLTLNTDKLTQTLGFKTQDIYSGLDHFHALYIEGYAEKLQSLGTD